MVGQDVFLVGFDIPFTGSRHKQPVPLYGLGRRVRRVRQD
jgi:hypothetical protein